MKSHFARRAAGLPTQFAPAHCPSELPPDLILFDSGFAAPQVLPDLSEFARIALTDYREESLQYSPTHGQAGLRNWIAEQMNREGCSLTAQNILITNGAKHALDLVCRLFLDEGDAIIVTAPTYFTAIPIFRSFGVEFIEAVQDENGIDVAALAETLAERKARNQPAPKFIYNIPEFHNPSGVTMSEERRRALIGLAIHEGAHIIEDSPYRSVRFEGVSPPMLKAIDPAGVVLHLGTFSKLVAPGVRIGWAAADASLIARLIRLKSDGGSSPLAQRILLEFSRSPAFEAHVARVCEVYCERRDRMMAEIARKLPEAKMHCPDGGYYIWVTFPERVDGDAVAAAASDLGVRVLPGSKFFASERTGQTSRNHIRLSYSYATPEQIEKGVDLLAKAYRTVTF